MAEPADVNVDELRRRARRRLVGAVVLALGVAVVVPMLLETEQKPLGDNVSVKIPPVDNGKFVNRLNDGTATGDPNANVADGTTKALPTTPAATEPVPERPQKYDTRLPEATPTPSAATPPSVASAAAAAPANAPLASNAPPVIITDKSIPPSQPAPTKRGAESPKVAAAAPHRAPEAGKAGRNEGGAPQHEGFAVQLAAFADDRGANSLAGRLKKAGYAAYTEPLKTSKGTLWRVRVGPYPSRDAALAARDKLKTEGQSGIVAAIK